MYFLVGWPKLFKLLLNNEKISAIQYSHDKTLVAVVTHTTLYIFSGDQKRLILGYYYRNKSSVGKDGANENVYWVSNDMLAIMTRNGAIYFVKVEEDTSKDMLEFQFDKEEDYISIGSKFRMKLSLVSICSVSQSGIAWLAHRDNVLYICTRDCYLQKRVKKRSEYVLEEEVPLHGLTVVPTMSVLPSPSLSSSAPKAPVPPSPKKEEPMLTVEPILSESATIVFAEHESSLGILTIVTSEGQVALITGSLASLSSLRIFWLPVANAVCASVNSRHHLIAVGCKSGEVHLYNMLNNYHLERTYSLAPWGILPEDTGAVSVLSWTPDQKVLAVGYQLRGLSVWSISGCRLQCTITQNKLLQQKSKISTLTTPQKSRSASSVNPEQEGDDKPVVRELLHAGVVTLAWGPEGYNLLIASPDKPNILQQLSFVKSCISTNPNLNYCQRILLQGEDSLYLLYNSGGELGELKWKHVQLPSQYVADNWPVKIVSLSHDGNFIAVSGTRGFTIYNIATSRWLLFGDRNEEQELICCGLCWYQQLVIVTNYNESKDAFELLFFSRNRLSKSAILYRSLLPQQRKPLFVDCNDTYLVLFTVDSFFYQYRILTVGEGDKLRIELRLVQQVSVARAISSPTSILLLPSNVQLLDQEENKPVLPSTAKCIILDSSGTLALTNAEKSIYLPLANHVEQFWMANTEMEDLGNTLWAYGDLGLEVWYPFFSTQRVKPIVFLSRDKSLEFDLEVYPIGFVPQWAVIVGISQRVSYSAIADTPYFELSTKTQPFLHLVLRRMLEKGQHEDAVKIAKKYSYIPHFSHSLELLLYETLDEEYSYYQNRSKRLEKPASATSPERKEGELLRHVINFLKEFHTIYVDAVVACARKTDPACWPTLFHPEYGADHPKVLFEECVKQQRIEVAASYLRVLQIMEGDAECRRASIKVVEMCLRQENMDVLKDLMRFLIPADGESPIQLEQYQAQSTDEDIEDLDDLDS